MASSNLAPSAQLAYDVLADQVVRQVTAVEGLDNKLGAAVAVLIALAGGVYAANPPAIVAGVISAWLAVALVQAIRGFRYDKDFADGVNAKFLEERLELEQAITKQHALEVLKAASAANKKRLDRKGQHLTQVAATAGLVAMVALLAKMIGIA